MKKSKNALLAFLVLGVLAVGLVVFMFSMKQPQPTTTGVESANGSSYQSVDETVGKETSNRTTPEELTVAHVESSYESALIRRIELESQFHTADSAASAKDAIESLYREGFDSAALELEGRLAAFCYPEPMSVSLDSQQWLGSVVQEYCGSLVFADEDFTEAAAQFTLNFDRQISELRSQFQGLSSTEKNELLLQKIEEASSWRELELLKIVLRAPPPFRESNSWVYDLGQDEGFSGESVRDAQVAALQLFQCETLGSFCGPNHLATINECNISQLCQAGWSMRDYYENTLSQIELEQMEKVLQYLREIRGS